MEMTITKAHTDGPWVLEKRTNKYKAMGSEKENEALGKLGKLNFDALSVGTSRGQVAIIPLDESNIENALLISAAPDMFEALKSVVYDLEHPAGSDISGLTIASINRSIAKAKGQLK